MLSTCRAFSLHKTLAWDQVASLHLLEAHLLEVPKQAFLTKSRSPAVSFLFLFSSVNG